MEVFRIIKIICIFRSLGCYCRSVINMENKLSVSILEISYKCCSCGSLITDKNSAAIYTYTLETIQNIFSKIIISNTGNNRCTVSKSRCCTDKNSRCSTWERASEILSGLKKLYIFFCSHDLNEQFTHNYYFSHISTSYPLNFSFRNAIDSIRYLSICAPSAPLLRSLQTLISAPTLPPGSMNGSATTALL